MPFFNGSSDLTIANSYLSEITGDFLNINLATQESAAAFITQLLGKRRERDSGDISADGPRKRYRSSSRDLDGLMIMRPDDVKLLTELISANTYRMHSASHGAQGRVVVVKVFDGPHAKQDWTKNVEFLTKFLHPNMPKIVGVSEESLKVPFVVLHGIAEKKIQSLIAKALRTDLNQSVGLSMKTVKGLAAGLHFMKSQKIDFRGWENFDILAGDNEEPVIAMHLPSAREDGSVAHSFVVESNHHGIEALNGLCQKLFSEANSVLYDDSPQRELDTYNAESLLTTSPQEVSEGTSNISESGGISTPSSATKSKRTPRREVRWRLDMTASTRSLDSIAQRFGDYLDCFLSSSSDLPLRRIRASKDAYSRLQTSHKCPGYLREEITLTSDISRSAIISHEYPSQSELCSVCGQLVEYQVRQPHPQIQHPLPPSVSLQQYHVSMNEYRHLYSHSESPPQPSNISNGDATSLSPHQMRNLKSAFPNILPDDLRVGWDVRRAISASHMHLSSTTQQPQPHLNIVPATPPATGLPRSSLFDIDDPMDVDDPEARDLNDFWKQYLHLPWSGSGISSSMSGGSEGVTHIGNLNGSKTVNSSAPPPGYHRPRVASLPPVKTPIMERESLGYPTQMYPNQVSTSNANVGDGPPPAAYVYRLLEETPGTTPMSTEDLRLFEAAVMARKAPTTLNLRVKRPIRGRGRV